MRCLQETKKSMGYSLVLNMTCHNIPANLKEETLQNSSRNSFSLSQFSLINGMHLIRLGKEKLKPRCLQVVLKETPLLKRKQNLKTLVMKKRNFLPWSDLATIRVSVGNLETFEISATELLTVVEIQWVEVVEVRLCKCFT